MEENKDDLGSINDYLGPQKLEAADVEDVKMEFACVGITKEQYDDQKSPVLRLALQNAEKDYYLNLNKTNLDILGDHMQEAEMVKLSEFVGCVFTFDKRKVTNPNTGKLMESLLINSIRK